MTKATDLLLAYENLDWEVYVALSEDLTSINMNGVDDELAKQATIFSYYSGLYEYAKKDHDILQIELDEERADARIRAQQECEQQGKRPTANILDAYVTSDAACKILVRNLADCSSKVGLLKRLMNALSQKKDTLVQIASAQREEKKIYS